MRNNAAALLATLTAATTALAGYPSWVLWILGVGALLFGAIVAGRRLWLWIKATGQDAQVDGAIADGMRSLLARLSTAQSPATVERLTDSVIKMAGVREELRRR